MLKNKQYWLLPLLTVVLVLCLVSCTGDGKEGDTEEVLYTVTFDSQGGTAIPSQQVVSGGKVTEPTIPVREGFVFDCWRNEDTGILWSFVSGVVEEDITLRADWIAADQIFEIEQIGDGDTARVTGLKDREMSEYRLPTMVKGFTVVSIGESAFARLDCEKVSRIVLPETVTSIEAQAFVDCKDILIEVEGKLGAIGESAFKNCNGLLSVTLDEGMTELSAEAFWGCVFLKEIRLPSTLRVIGENAFQDCMLLRELQLSEGIESIEDGAFFGCSSLTVLYFMGEEQALEQLLESVAPKNEPFVNCEQCYLYSETQPQEDTVFEGYWYLDKDYQFRLWKTE